VDVYSIDEAFLDLTGIDRVVSFEPFGRQAIWLKVESPDGYDTTVNACACCRLTPGNLQAQGDAELTKGREATARLRELVANAQRIEVVDSGQADKYDRRLVHLLIDGRDVGQTLMAEG
jgi:nucleotidyltransferase/DNA polymerase involved in DNA repair